MSQSEGHALPPDKLLPCPFCGGEAQRRENMGDIHMVQAFCRRCRIGFAESGVDATGLWERVAARWNSRAERPREIMLAAMERVRLSGRSHGLNSLTGQDVEALLDGIAKAKEHLSNTDLEAGDAAHAAFMALVNAEQQRGGAP